MVQNIRIQISTAFQGLEQSNQNTRRMSHGNDSTNSDCRYVPIASNYNKFQSLLAQSTSSLNTRQILPPSLTLRIKERLLTHTHSPNPIPLPLALNIKRRRMKHGATTLLVSTGSFP